MKEVWVVMKCEVWEPGDWIDKIFESEDKAMDYLKDFRVTHTDSKTNKPCSFEESKNLANGLVPRWLYTLERVEVH